ncbi:MAG: alpha-L-fucosidase [Puniceicoccaceae bacterium]
MKRVIFCFSINLALAVSLIAGQEYEPNWESLISAPIPEWVKDAKFGVYTHWGPYSVPAYETNTYISDMYAPTYEKSPKGVKEHHEKTYGPVAEVGYKEIIDMFTAPKFDAAEWVGVMEDSGAKFAGICTVHHDGFCLWDSAFTRWDSMDKGPRRDVFGEIAKEVRKTDMKLLATFHHARSYGYALKSKKSEYTAEQLKTYDVFDPQYNDLYRDKETVPPEVFGEEWHNKIEEVLAKYDPDMIWFDGLAQSIDHDVISTERLAGMFADYLNQDKPVTICNKLPAGPRWNFPVGFGLRCYENGRDMEADPRGFFLIDRAISYPWTYTNDKNYNLTPEHHIKSFVDLVARGGIFLISLTPKGDGSIPEQEKVIMKAIGDWLLVNGDGIYGTRPWKIVEEGFGAEQIRILQPSKKREGAKTARWDYKRLEKTDEIAIRFMKKGNDLYTFVIGEPEGGTVLIKSLAKGNVERSGKGIKRVSMLGSDASIEWKQTKEGLELTFPDKLPCEFAYGFKVEVNGKLDQSERPAPVDGEPRVAEYPIFTPPNWYPASPD